MKDATLRQGNKLSELVLQAEDPSAFLQNLIERWGAVQLIGQGKVTQAQLIEALQYIETNTRAQAPKGQPRSIEEQVKLFQKFIPMLDVSQVGENVAMATAQLTPGASLFCYVRTGIMAAFLDIENQWDNFGVLTEKTVGLLAPRRKFHNCRVGQLGGDYYRLLASTKAGIEKIEAQQKGDIIVLPAQLGELYRGKSVDQSRDLIRKSGSQFCLPAFIVGQILLVNPGILTSNQDLFIDCPGDEYRLSAREPFSSALCFNVGEDGLLYLLSGWPGGPCDDYGSAWGVFQ